MFKCTKIFFFVFLTIFLKFSVARVIVQPSVIREYPIGYQYYVHNDYYTTWNLFRSQNEPRKDIKITFNCTKNGESRMCDIVSSLPSNIIWGHLYSHACGSSFDGIETDCTLNLCDNNIPRPHQVKLSKRVPTSGGIVTISGKNLRLCTPWPQYLLSVVHGMSNLCPIAGDIEDPDFDCENLVVNFFPGSGKGVFQFQYNDNGFVPFIFAAPIVNYTKYDKLKLSLTLNGDNFYFDNSLVNISLDNVPQTDFKITINHTQIVINNFKRIYGGPMDIKITVDSVPMEVTSYYCFHPLPLSVSSVSNNLGGVITINGELFPQPGSNKSYVNIIIGSEKCYYIKSTSTTIECELNKKTNKRGTQPITISINNTNSIQCSNTNQFYLTYNIPNAINAVQKMGSKNVTVNGSILGSIGSTKVIVNSQYVIIPFTVSEDETKLEFELPELKCGNNIKIRVINDGNPSNEISFNAEIFVVPYHSPFVNNGSDLSLYILYIQCSLPQTIIPTSTFDSRTPSTPCTIPTDVGDYYSTTCNVLPGSGSKHFVNIGYNGKSFKTKFSYAPPLLLDYSIDTDDATNSINVTVNGVNFNTNVDLFSATFSNRTIIPINGTLKDNEFKFNLNEYDENSYISITVDGIKNPIEMFIPQVPSEIHFNEFQSISTKFGKIELTGKNLLSSFKSIEPKYQIRVFANNSLRETKLKQDNLIEAEIPGGAGVLYVSVFVGNNIVKSSNIRYYDHTVASNNALFDATIKTMVVDFIGSNFSKTAQIFLTNYPELGFKSCDLDFDTNVSTPFSESNKLGCKFDFDEKVPFLITELHIGGIQSNHNITVIDVESMNSSLHPGDGNSLTNNEMKIVVGITVAGAFCLVLLLFV